MKLFGYKLKIEKSIPDKRITIVPKSTNGKVNYILFEGSDWKLFEKVDMKDIVEIWIEHIEVSLPSIDAKGIVRLLNIFAGKVCSFELAGEYPVDPQNRP